MKLVRKTEVLRPTRWGCLLLFLLIGILSGGVCSQIYPFLALNRPLSQAELMIVEGWIDDSTLTALYAEATPGARFITTGGPIKYGASLLKEKTYAEVCTARLLKLGVPARSILTIPAPDVAKNRTYVSALAVRRALEERGLFGRPANLYSVGAHSRRSYQLYRFAFGAEAPLGVVVLEPEDVDLSRWWASSHAFKHVMTEFVSWFYVQCTRWQYGE